MREPLLEADAFGILAAIKRHALAVLAHAHHIETEICLVALLVEIQPNQTTSDEMRADRA